MSEPNDQITDCKFVSDIEPHFLAIRDLQAELVLDYFVP